jgi:molybdopterin-synthase adenylyltransferase
MAGRILFCGVGALGSTAALLCRNLPADAGVELALCDFDRVEAKNLRAQGFTKQALGKNKAEALKLQLWNFWGVKADAYPVRLTGENVASLCASATLLVDCFDNLAGRQVLSAHARAAGPPLVHAALSGDGSVGLVRFDARFHPDAEDHAGQATCEDGEHLPFIGLLAGVLARAIQDFVRTGEQRDSLVTLTGVQRT